MDKEFIDHINRILAQKEIDDRVKPLIKLYFLGKFNLGDLSENQLEAQIDTLCSRISNVEFSSNNIVAAYTSKSSVLTINKQLFIDGKSDEVILPVFMKFESALNQSSRRYFSNHVEDFIRAGRIAKGISIPISDRLYKLYEMAEYCYGDIENKISELIKDGTWEGTCSKYNKALNEMIITGKNVVNELLNGANLFHYRVFTSEALENPDFEGPFKNEEYQRKTARILATIDNIINSTEKDSLIKNIKLFTGCTNKMVELARNEKYQGDSRISNVLESTFESTPEKPTEEYIASKVQAVLDRKPEYDSRIKHLIIPFFIRSQKIYDWDIDEFQERLNQVDLKIDKIVFEDLGNILTMGDTGGDKIRFNSRIFFDRNGKQAWPILKTFFHELGHNTDVNNRESIKTKEALQIASLGSGRFYEWCNTVFEKLASGESFYKRNNPMRLSQSGYEALAPLGSMLSCALGISEIEFAKIKDKGKEYEKQFLGKIFPRTTSEENDKPQGAEILDEVKDIFDSYNLNTEFSLSKKRFNQNLLNDMYAECLMIMQKRIQNEIQSGKIQDLETYKKYQMFFLKKMNFNFKTASKSNGFRFSKSSIITDIGFGKENLSKKDLEKIANEFVSMADFGFDNSALGKYSTTMMPTRKDKRAFLKSIHQPAVKSVQPNKTEKPQEPFYR